jgi:hypothetical protein
MDPHREEKLERELAAWNEAQRLVTALLESTFNYRPPALSTLQAIVSASSEVHQAAITPLCMYCLSLHNGSGIPELLRLLFANYPVLSTEQCEALAVGLASAHNWRLWDVGLPALERYIAAGGRVTDTLRASISDMRVHVAACCPAGEPEYIVRLGALLGETVSPVEPRPGELWSDTALRDLQTMPVETREAWQAVFAVAGAVPDGNRSRTWQKSAAKAREQIDDAEFYDRVCAWFEQVTTPPQPPPSLQNYPRFGSQYNITLLKGLAWMCAGAEEPRVARALAALVTGTLKKAPGVGPWAIRVTNAAVLALGEMESPESVAQLVQLTQRASYRPALQQIDKALEAIARRKGVSRADLIDMSVPAYDFDIAGVRRQEFGECYAVATLTPTGGIETAWYAANAKPVKSIPTSVKRDHADALKQFKADLDAAAKMLSAQKARFDVYSQPEPWWPFENWRTRFAERPLLSRITNRLIWQVQTSGATVSALWDNGRFIDSYGNPIERAEADTGISLWHPLHSSPEEVARWREILQSRAIVQPFKQAHREVYILTEAERQTRTYSNRFAGHILKQHQMHALAGIRGWKDRLRLLVDDSVPPPAKEIPGAGLRAEFWVEGVGDDYGVDTNDSGVFLYLATDQVRFESTSSPQNFAHAEGGGYAMGRWGRRAPDEGIPLEEIPPIVFSEVMRDVDLFVGVCSVGNDPNWEDGGPQGRYRDYWHEYGFGDLTQTAKTRREVLERLVPRLKIASRCSFTDRFLVVRGDIRTYKIHLGSGNILMEPNDQYLCIVEARGQSQESVGFLPFEGDSRLSLILSKAFLLADDKKITDPTILLQIGR